MSDLTTNIPIDQPSVFNDKYVVAFTVHIHATYHCWISLPNAKSANASLIASTQTPKVLHLASLSKSNSNSKSAIASLTVTVKP